MRSEPVARSVLGLAMWTAGYPALAADVPAGWSEPGQSAVELNVGVDSSVLTTELVGRRTVEAGPVPVELRLAMASPVFVFGTDNRLSATIATRFSLWKTLGATVSVSPLTWTRSTNEANQLRSIGSGMGAGFGHMGEKWQVLGTVDYGQAWTTHVSHSELYRELVYEDAEDGWYRLTGGTFTFALDTTRRILMWDVSVAAGVVRTNALAPLLFVPGVKATIGLSRRF